MAVCGIPQTYYRPRPGVKCALIPFNSPRPTPALLGHLHTSVLGALSPLSLNTGASAMVPLATAVATASSPLPPDVSISVTAGLLQATAAALAVTVAAAHPLAQHTTALLGKDERTGHFPWYSWALFWPYHVLLRLLTRVKLHKHAAVEPLWTHIQDEWYIGGWPMTTAELPKPDIAVLDCTCELPTVANPDRYFNIGVWDTTAPTDAQISAAVAWGLEQKARGRAVLVHCAHGHGRSCVVLCALLVASGIAPNGYEEALSIIKAKRPFARLSEHQRPGLDTWYKRYVGGSKQAASTDGDQVVMQPQYAAWASSAL